MSRLLITFQLIVLIFLTVYCCDFELPKIVGYDDGYIGIRLPFKVNRTRTCIKFRLNDKNLKNSMCVLNSTETGSETFYHKYQNTNLKIGDSLYYKVFVVEQSGDTCDSEVIQSPFTDIQPTKAKEDL